MILTIKWCEPNVRSFNHLARDLIMAHADRKAYVIIDHSKVENH